MAETVTIRVPRQARDHLARVAKDRGITLRQLVEQLAAEQLTLEQAAERMGRRARGVAGTCGRPPARR
jgi:heme oxygenase